MAKKILMLALRKILLILLYLLIIFCAYLIIAPFSRAESPKWEYYTIKEGDVLENIFGAYWIDVLRFNKIDRNHLWPGRKIKKPLNFEDIKNYTPLSDFYEPSAQYEKYVLINLDEQFLGCYEFGHLKLSFPIASGRKNYRTPKGDFKVLARHRDHFSTKYTITGTNIPYPMTWAVKFYVSKSGIGFWIHGRDLPGYPVSHGCIGLYDEEMQKKYYKKPRVPVLMDAKKFYLWLFPGEENDGALKSVSGRDIPIRIL